MVEMFSSVISKSKYLHGLRDKKKKVIETVELPTSTKS